MENLGRALKKGTWSEEEERLLKSNIHLMPSELSEILGRSKIAIMRMITAYGLSEEREHWEKEYLKENYRKPLGELMPEMARGRDYIHRLLVDMGIDRPKIESRPRKLVDINVESVIERDYMEFCNTLNNFYSDKLKVVEIGRRCRMEELYTNQHGLEGRIRRILKGRFISDYDKFYLFEDEKNGLKEAFLKIDVISGRLRVKNM